MGVLINVYGPVQEPQTSIFIGVDGLILNLDKPMIVGGSVILNVKW
jgi:hypothetical protein